MHKKLFIPGPVEVVPEVLQKMAIPMIGHRSKEASALQRRISDNLRKLFYTNSEILISTSSGSGLMEGAIRSCTLKRAAVFSVGAFGKRWYEMAVENNVPADLFEVEMGKAVDPDEVDKALSTGKYDLVAVTHNETSTGIKNPIEGKTRTRSVGIKLYESTPLSYFNKGEELELEKYGLVTLHSKIKKQDIENSNETIDLSDFLPEPEESIYSEADNTIYHPIPLYGRSE